MTYENWPVTNDICHWSLANSHMSLRRPLDIPTFDICELTVRDFSLSEFLDKLRNRVANHYQKSFSKIQTEADVRVLKLFSVLRVFYKRPG